jgi:hypothetical protein
MEFANATITGAGRKDSEKRVGIRAGNETLTGSAARDPAAAGEAEGDGGRRHAVGLCPSPRLWHGLWGNAGGKEAERQVADDDPCQCVTVCACAAVRFLSCASLSSRSRLLFSVCSILLIGDNSNRLWVNFFLSNQ